MLPKKREQCTQCLRPRSVCFCSELELHDISQKILIIRDKVERNHPFNTAIMAKLQISNLEILDSDSDNFEFILDEFIKKYHPFLLFKNHQSNLLAKENLLSTNLNNFIAIDGTWDKARAIFLKYKILYTLPIFHIELSSGQTTIYKDIRRTDIKDALSTLEALQITLETLNQRDFSALLRPLKFTIQTQARLSKISIKN